MLFNALDCVLSLLLADGAARCRRDCHSIALGGSRTTHACKAKQWNACGAGA
jgi:hypothetical protein